MVRMALAALLLLSLAGPPGCVSGKESGAENWQPLFDGRTLTGWTQRGGKASYRIEGGEIVGTTVVGKENSFLCTEREFADFVLECEFKVDPRLNSGLQIRSQSVPGYQQGRVHGYQVEIDPSERAWSGGIYDESRRGWLADLKQNDAARNAFHPGQWNRVRVAARDDSLKTWLNDVPAADLRDGLTHSGFIALQVHATEVAELLEVRWRHLRIRDLGDPWRRPPKDAVVLLAAERDLENWAATEPAGGSVPWVLANGALTARPGTGSIQTRQAFGDCRLHVEFNVEDNGEPEQNNGNSGVYIQGRYEVQILNSSGREPADNLCGAIYRTRAPDYNMAQPAGQWQTYDIWFRAPRWNAGNQKLSNARVTVYHNGTRIHDDVEIPNKTGAGQPEGPLPRPLLLQEHGSAVRFRNIWIAPLCERDGGSGE